MALNKDLVFGFNHSEQIDRLYEIMTSAQIKASFDKRGEDLKNYIYSIIDKLVSEEIESGASNIGLYPVNGLTAKNVQDAIKQLKEDMINVVLGDIPSGAISDIKLSDLEGQIKDKVNKLIIDVANNSTQLGEKATFKNGSGTFPINQTTFTVTDAFVTVNTLITVIPKTEKNGTWSVVSNNGNFVITSDSIETVAVSFDWAGVK